MTARSSSSLRSPTRMARPPGGAGSAIDIGGTDPGQLDELGDFWVSLSCEGAESCESFTSNAIKGLKIVFTPGVDFENLINKAEFSPVASRAAQSAILKAEKTGQKTVDLEAAKKKPNTEDGDNKPSGDNGATGGTNGGGEQTGGSGNTGENGDNSDNTENG